MSGFSLSVFGFCSEVTRLASYLFCFISAINSAGAEGLVRPLRVGGFGRTGARPLDLSGGATRVPVVHTLLDLRLLVSSNTSRFVLFFLFPVGQCTCGISGLCPSYAH